MTTSHLSKAPKLILTKRRKYNQFHRELLLKGKLKNVLREFKKISLVYLINKTLL